MPLTVALVTSLFLLGAASGALLVSLRFAPLRERIRAQAAEDLQRALFRKYRMEDSISTDGRRPATTACGSAAPFPEHAMPDPDGPWTQPGHLRGMSRNSAETK
jgi:hypothetical protein